MSEQDLPSLPKTQSEPLTDAGPNCALATGSALRDGPYLSAPSSPASAHAKTKVVARLANSIDGSGAWVGLHLLSDDGRFIQGGWMREQNTSIGRSTRD